MIDDNLRSYLADYQSPLVVAVSGGMDSIVLLHMLVTRRDIVPFSIHVATFDHGLRPESGDDVQFVVEQSIQWNVPYTTGAVNEALMGNIELSARQARYQFLARVAHEVGAGWVATAHHADDQAETILQHLIRGAGLRGLGGMQVASLLPYDDGLNIFRPMLSMTRAQIEAYCHQHGLDYRHDMTNDDVTYTRNYIRHQVMPMLETINPDVVGALNRLGETVRQDYQFLSDVAQVEFDKGLIVRGDDYIAINRQHFDGLSVALQRQLLIKMAWECYQLSPTHERILEAYDLIQAGKVGTFVDFIGANPLYLNYDALILGDYRAYFRQRLPYIRLKQDEMIEIDLSADDKLYRGDGWELHISQQQTTSSSGLRLGVHGVKQAVIRTRRDGDYFAPAGMNGRGKKLKAWLIDRKIPQVIRDEIGLIVFDGQVVAILYGDVWAMGHQSDMYFKKILFVS